MLLTYYSTKPGDFIFRIYVAKIIAEYVTYRLWFVIQPFIRFCFEIDILMQVVTLTPKTADITTRTVYDYVKGGKVTYKFLEVCLVRFRIFQGYNHKVSISTDRLGSIRHLIYSG